MILCVKLCPAMNTLAGTCNVIQFKEYCCSVHVNFPVWVLCEKTVAICIYIHDITCEQQRPCSNNAYSILFDITLRKVWKSNSHLRCNYNNTNTVKHGHTVILILTYYSDAALPPVLWSTFFMCTVYSWCADLQICYCKFRIILLSCHEF